MYRQVQTLPPVVGHCTVHSVEFVNSITGVHTQNMGSYWNTVGLYMQDLTLGVDDGVYRHQLAFYLGEFMWREKKGCNIGNTFTNITVEIAIQYPV